MLTNPNPTETFFYFDIRPNIIIIIFFKGDDCSCTLLSKISYTNTIVENTNDQKGAAGPLPPERLSVKTSISTVYLYATKIHLFK